MPESDPDPNLKIRAPMASPDKEHLPYEHQLYYNFACVGMLDTLSRVDAFLTFFADVSIGLDLISIGHPKYQLGFEFGQVLHFTISRVDDSKMYTGTLQGF